ncbi:MAG: sigma-70 family RNA polymerase sigma factor [Planctomycetota bacterium]|nr:MAG: sigma-70 family RNA polymerase sigma factor [Planctomycetota bacterium]
MPSQQDADPSRAGPKTSPTHLARLAEGDEQAWELFNEVYAPLIRRWAKWFCKTDVEDIVQQVSVSMYKALQVNRSFKYDPSKGGFRKYLSTCARNAALASLRRKHPAALASEPPSDLEERWRHLEREEVIHHALRELVRSGEISTRNCEVFVRNKLRLESPGALAKEMGISEARVYVIVHEVREKLTGVLKEHYAWLA